MAEQVKLLGATRCNDAVGEDNKMRRYIPYFVSALLAQKRLVGAERFSGVVGLFLHLAVWITVAVLDCYLLGFRFQDTSSMLHMLQIAALVTVSIAGATVLLCWFLHICMGPSTSWSFVVCWNEALLPPFVSSIILSNIRASLEFSKFILFFSVFEPIAEVQNAPVARDIKNILIVIICLKYLGISLTMAQHKFKVYDETH